jgi:hypothetical protein
MARAHQAAGDRAIRAHWDRRVMLYDIYQPGHSRLSGWALLDSSSE